MACSRLSEMLIPFMESGWKEPPWIKQALLDGKITVYGTGEEVREYVHVWDAAKLSVDILSKEFKNKHVVITGHHPIKFKEMLNTIKEMLDGKVELEFRAPKEDSRYAVHYTMIQVVGNE